MLKCCLLLLVVGMACALPAENREKQSEQSAIDGKSVDNAPEAAPADAPGPVAVAGDSASKPEKPGALEESDDKNKESLESSELFWGGYKGWGWGRGWGGWGGWGWGGPVVVRRSYWNYPRWGWGW